MMITKRITDEKGIDQTEDTVLVLGYFDGLHKGHQALFEKAREIAVEQGLKIAVMTFPESPKLAFVRYQPELMLHLASPEDRMVQLESLGVDYLYLIDFTSHFAGNTARDFFEKYVSRGARRGDAWGRHRFHRLRALDRFHRPSGHCRTRRRRTREPD